MACKLHVGVFANLPYVLRTVLAADDSTRTPMILFLHGAGERGYGEKGFEKVVMKHCPRSELRSPGSDEFAVLAPQCPTHTVWTSMLASVSRWVHHATAKQYIDASRISVVNLWMGAFGACALAIM